MDDSRPPKRQRRGAAGAGGRACPLAGVCVVVSGIVNPERAELRDIALQLGAEYRSDWEACATHLIAPFDGTENGGRPTPKSAAARESDAYVVKPSWLRACAAQQQRVNEAGHLLGPPPQTISLLDEEEEVDDGGGGSSDGVVDADADDFADDDDNGSARQELPKRKATRTTASAATSVSPTRSAPTDRVFVSSSDSDSDSDATVDLERSNEHGNAMSVESSDGNGDGAADWADAEAAFAELEAEADSSAEPPAPGACPAAVLKSSGAAAASAGERANELCVQNQAASVVGAVDPKAPMRPACQQYDPAGPLVFMLLDSTHDDATITLYGITARGESVMVVVHGFLPYFYVRAPTDSNESEFGTELGRRMAKGADAVVRVERLTSRSIMHYTTETHEYYRVTVAKPQLVGPAVKALQEGEGDWEHTLEASESKPSKYEERFMIDADITGGGWVKLQAGQWTYGDAGDAQLCAEVAWDSGEPPLTSAGSQARYQRLCPLRVLSIDILQDGAIRQLHQPLAQTSNLLGLTVSLDPGAGGELYQIALIVCPQNLIGVCRPDNVQTRAGMQVECVLRIIYIR